MKVSEICFKWIEFFVSKGYKIELSVLFVFYNDLFFLWINVGMVLFKLYFDGCEKLENLCFVNF